MFAEYNVTQRMFSAYWNISLHTFYDVRFEASRLRRQDAGWEGGPAV